MTIKDVAKRAGVSVATVSRAINQPEKLSAETLAAVNKAVAALNYTPNSLGRSLRRAATGNVLALLPTVSNSFYGKVVSGMDEAADRLGLDLLICNTYLKPEKERYYLSLLERRSFDGAIILASALPANELVEISRRFPLVFACEYVPGVLASRVCIDDQKAGHDATSYLISRGHRRIAFVGDGSDTRQYSAVLREEGYRLALFEAGIPAEEALILQESISYAAGKRAAKRLLSDGKRPDAVFCAADSIAVGVAAGCKEAGLSICRDISIMGFDDIQISRVYTPNISTVSQPRVMLGQRAMELLHSRINGDGETEQIVLEHMLKIRASTR